MNAYLPLLTFMAMVAIVSAFVISLYRRSRSRWGPAPARQAPAIDAADFYSPSMMAMPSSDGVAASASVDAASFNCAGAGGSSDGGGASGDSSASSGDSSSCDSFDSGGSSSLD